MATLEYKYIASDFTTRDFGPDLESNSGLKKDKQFDRRPNI